jgi:glycine cleavage system H lipoate-binding protein
MQNSFEGSSLDFKCIWMMAGIINYKLCNRNFQCENCEFHKVMQGILPNNNSDPDYSKNFFGVEDKKDSDVRSNLINQYLYTIFSDCKIHLDRFYSPSHFWYKVDSENTALVGIDKLLIKILEPIDGLIMPEIGKTFSQEQLITWIVRKGKTLPLHTPVTGKVVEINSLFLQKGIKKVIVNDAYYFKMEEKGLGEKIQQLSGHIRGVRYFTDNVSLVRKYLEKAFLNEQPANIGPTLADGGRIQICMEKVIGEKLFRHLVDTLINGTKISKIEIV